MKISGFTFIRNAVKYDYPVVESICSILPLVDELIIAVGQSEDGTRKLIENIGSKKIRIIDTVWDDSLREGGAVLAIETNKAFDEISRDSDWAFYIQGDEIIHEKYLPAIRQAMEQYKDDQRVEGLLFKYLHFYGSYDYVGDSRRWYRNEIRIVRPDPSIRSYKDAMGFRKDDRKLNVKPIDAFVYHYGWVKHPREQQEKRKTFNKYWHNDEWMKKNIEDVDNFDYSKIDSLQKFESDHPAIMKERIEKVNWTFSFDPTQKKLTLKEKISFWIEKVTGIRPGEYKNYKIL
ncbi:MAG: glycosyltransferase family 2 protein [Leptospirales bacterium]